MMNEQQKRFVKIIEGLRYGKSVGTVFEDFVRLGTYEISQNTRRSLGCEIDETDEKAYMEIVGKYKPEQIRGPFKDMFSCLVEGLEAMEGDFLGPIFMQMKLGNASLGQFFTPYHISLLMAELSIDHDTIRREIDGKGYFVMNDPCCGSGGFPIAYAQAFREAGYDPETELFIVAQDLGSTVAQMCFVQLSLRGLAAQVLNMNSLIPEKVFWGRYTPMFFWKNWPMRLQENKNEPAGKPDPLRIEDATPKIAEAKKPERRTVHEPPKTPMKQRSLLDDWS